MITVEELKKQSEFNATDLTDEEVQKVLDLIYQFSDLLFELWSKEKIKTNDGN